MHIAVLLCLVAVVILDKVLEGKEHTTLYTDETRKYGKCIQTYVLTDETQTSYILGLREMFNKTEGTEFGTLPHSFETSLITLPTFSDGTFKFVRFMTHMIVSVVYLYDD
jgi:hypothetical protein